MSRVVRLCTALLIVLVAVSSVPVGATRTVSPLVVTMTNDPVANRIQVYDGNTHALVQTLSTHGKGGVGGNARGIQQYAGEILAVVNNGSGTVALFRREGHSFRFDRLVIATSAPVSVDFGNGHLYVAGASTVDSFVMHGPAVGWMDGSASLELAGGGSPAPGRYGAGGRARSEAAPRHTQDRSRSGHGGRRVIA